MEHDWKLAAGADASAIVLSVEGTASVHLESNGDLELRSDELSVLWRAPNSFQLLGATRLPVESRYVVQGRRITLQLGAYRHDLPLTVDPLIDFSYFVKGNEDDRGCQVAVDSAGNIYLAGLTQSSDFQTTQGAVFSTSASPGTAAYQVFVRKISPDASTLIYSTYLGTTGLYSNHPLGMRVDSSGNVYLAGLIFLNSPAVTSTPIDPQGSIGVYKLAPDGSKLLYATRVLPSLEYPEPVVLDIDSTGNAYIGAGSTKIGVSKIDPTGTKQLFLYSAQVSNYFGGLSGIAAGADGTVYVAGTTAMGGLVTTPGALKTTVMNSQDFHGYLIRLRADGSAPIYSTYIGGDFSDDVYALAIDASGAAYVGGTTSSEPPFLALQGTSLGLSQPALTAGFVMKINPEGNAAVFTSLLPNTEVDAMALDSSGNVYAAGFDNNGVAMAKVSPSGGQLLYYSSIPCRIVTFDQSAIPFGLAVDSAGSALLTGSVGSLEIPEMAPGYVLLAPNAFLLKMDAHPDQTDLALDPPTASFVPGGAATVDFVIQNKGSAAAQDVVFEASELGQGPITQCRASGGGVCQTAPPRVTFASIPEGESETIEFQLGSCQSPLIPPNTVTQMAAKATVYTVTSDVHQDNNSTSGSASANFVPITIAANTPSFGPVNIELINVVSGAAQANLPCEEPNTPAYALPNAQVEVYWPTPQYSPLTGGTVAFEKWQDGSTENPRTFTATPPQLYEAAIFTPFDTPYFTVVNAGSYAEGGVSPGEFITLSGVNLSTVLPQHGQVQDGRFTTSLGGVSVRLDGTLAPLVYSSYGQINAIVPYEVAGRNSTAITVQTAGASASATVPVVVAAPSLFTADASGLGQAAALNQDSSVNSDANPANPGEVIVLFGTGDGVENPLPTDGAITSGTPPSPQLPVTVTIGGLRAKVNYAGAAPELAAGVIQINAVIPTGIVGRNVPVTWRAGTYSSQPGVTIAVNEAPAPGFVYQPSAENLGLAPISITLPRIAVNSEPTVVTIYGFGFLPGMVAEWNNQARLTQYLDETRLQILLTAADLESPELGSITVWNSSQTTQFSESAPLLVYLPLVNYDLVYDSTRDKIYVSVAASQMPQGSSIAILDPEAGRIENFYPLEAEATVLTLSGDNQYLYVAIGNKVRRINLDTWTADLDIPLGSDPMFGSREAVSMITLPGVNNSLAVSMVAPGVSGYYFLAIFDDSQMRPTTISAAASYSNQPTYLIGGPNAGTIYAANGEGDFFTLTVNAQGVAVTNNVPNLLVGDGDSLYSGGMIYGGLGIKADPTVPSVVTTYDNQGLIVPLTELSQVLILADIAPNNGAPLLAPVLTLSNGNGGARLWSLPMPLQLFENHGPLLRWGANGFVLREAQPLGNPAPTIDLFRLNLSTPGQ